MTSSGVVCSAFSALILVFLCINVSPTLALFTGCDHVYNINAGYTYIQSPLYPSTYPSGTSCRYHVRAPLDYEIVVNCTIALDKNPDSCSSEYFYLARDGDILLRDSEQVCGSGVLLRNSLFRSVTVAYASYSNNRAGKFVCQFYARPQACDCGWSVNTKIANGVEASINEYPHMVALKDKTNQYQNVFCGGTILTHYFVLTAAHCTKAVPYYQRILIRAGDHNLASTTETRYAAEYSVAEIIEHTGYTSDPVRNDIALLRTSEPIEWTRGTGPICLPPPNSASDNFAYQYVDVCGWGTLGFGAQVSNTLQKITLMVLDNPSCQQSYQGITTITTSQMCTYDYSGSNRDSCQFDSGGPVILRRARQFLLGAVSFGKVCGTGTYPVGVNTRITAYLSWINQKISYTNCIVNI